MLKKLIQKLLEWGKTPKQIEIMRIQNAIHRYDLELIEMNEYWIKVDGVCCPSCMFGQKYTHYENKKEHAQEQLDKLIKRK